MNVVGCYRWYLHQNGKYDLAQELRRAMQANKSYAVHGHGLIFEKEQRTRTRRTAMKMREINKKVTRHWLQVGLQFPEGKEVCSEH